jgi:GTP diphosphokinase / guanosine-3',5'-bis(diphosphate) 3'-diphosphatase
MPDLDQLAFLLRAIKFASEKHRNQTRKDGSTPYINHPIEVMEILASLGRVDDVDVLAAAVLHDTIEDTGTTAEELRTVFGDKVTFFVQECTDDKSLPKADRKRLQEEHAPRLSEGAKQIKMADKVSNMRDMVECPPPDWTWERRSEYLNWCWRVYSGLKGANPELEQVFERRHAESRRLLDERKPAPTT